MKFRRDHESEAASTEAVPIEPWSVVRVVELLDGDTILSSKPTGEQYRPAILQAAGSARSVVLDFSGAGVVTPSFFNAAVWELWNPARAHQYPLVANLPDVSTDDVEIAAVAHRTPVWTGAFNDDTLFSAPLLLGDLEEVDGLALKTVFEEDEVSASGLSRVFDCLSATGWNNRLAQLWRKKVLLRKKRGRMFVYTTPWKGELDG